MCMERKIMMLGRSMYYRNQFIKIFRRLMSDENKNSTCDDKRVCRLKKSRSLGLEIRNEIQEIVSFGQLPSIYVKLLQMLLSM